MLRALLLASLLACLAATGCASGSEATDANTNADASALTASLAGLLPPDGSLPASCSPRPLDDTAPPFLTANPMTSADPAFVRPLFEGAFRGDADPSQAKEALFSLYEAPYEVGLFAFRMANAASAEQLQTLAEQNADAQFIRRSGPILALVWRDGPDGPCFQRLTAHVAEAMAAAP